MKCRYMPLLSKCGLLLCLFVVYGCASPVKVSDHAQEWVARPLAELKQHMKDPNSYAAKVKWEETTYPLANGNYTFVEPVGKDCSMHWEVTRSGMLVGYRAVGNGCEAESSTGVEMIRKLTKPTDNW